jgi:hypothetical protein
MKRTLREFNARTMMNRSASARSVFLSMLVSQERLRDNHDIHRSAIRFRPAGSACALRCNSAAGISRPHLPHTPGAVCGLRGRDRLWHRPGDRPPAAVDHDARGLWRTIQGSRCSRRPMVPPVLRALSARERDPYRHERVRPVRRRAHHGAPDRSRLVRHAICRRRACRFGALARTQSALDRRGRCIRRHHGAVCRHAGHQHAFSAGAGPQRAAIERILRAHSLAAAAGERHAGAERSTTRPISAARSAALASLS